MIVVMYLLDLCALDNFREVNMPTPMLLLVNYTSDIYNLKGQMQLYGHQRVTIAVVKLHLISSSVSEHLLGDQFAKCHFLGGTYLVQHMQV